LIFENVKYESENDDEHDNMQFNPSIAKKFCNFIPTWSALMVPIFKYGDITETSSTSESLFNDLNTNVFKHKSIPLRIDQCFKIHVNLIIGSMNIIGSTLGASKPEIQYDNYLIDKKDEEVENQQNYNSGNNMNTYDWFAHNIEINYDNVNEFHSETEKNHDNANEFNLETDKNDSFEDWRGLGNPITIKNISCFVTNDLNNVPNNLITDIENHYIINKPVGKPEKKTKNNRKCNYLETDPTVVFYNDRSKTRSLILGILKNGNVSDFKPVNIVGFSYTVTNTCAFDS